MHERVFVYDLKKVINSEMLIVWYMEMLYLMTIDPSLLTSDEVTEMPCSDLVDVRNICTKDVGTQVINFRFITRFGTQLFSSDLYRHNWLVDGNLVSFVILRFD